MSEILDFRKYAEAAAAKEKDRLKAAKIAVIFVELAESCLYTIEKGKWEFRFLPHYIPTKYVGLMPDGALFKLYSFEKLYHLAKIIYYNTQKHAE